MNIPTHLFFDFDGTVYTDCRYTEENMAAMRYAQERGCRLILNTGRSQGHFETEPFAVECPVRWDARIYGMSDILVGDRVLARHIMRPMDVWRWIWYARRSKVEICIEGQRQYYGFYFENPEERDLQKVRSRVRRILREDRITKLAVVGAYDAEKTPKGNWNAIELPAWYEVLEAGKDKGTAILDYCRLVGADPSECACFGDSANDVGMFRVCATGICMKDSPRELREVASYCATGENGIAEGIAWIFREESEKSTKNA